MSITALIFLSLAMSISVGAFIALILTVGMNDGIPRTIAIIIISLAVGFGFVFLMNKYREYEEEKWNNGICPICNTEYHFQSVAKGRSSTTYYYVCENGHIFETDCFFQK